MNACRKALFLGIVIALIFALVPLFTKRNDLINALVLIFLYVTLAQSWNPYFALSHSLMRAFCLAHHDGALERMPPFAGAISVKMEG